MNSKERLSLEEMKAQANGGASCPKCGCHHFVKTDGGVVCRHCGGRSSPIDAVASKGTAGVLLRRTGFRAVFNSFPLLEVQGVIAALTSAPAPALGDPGAGLFVSWGAVKNYSPLLMREPSPTPLATILAPA